jgi:hypothetical protein
MRRDRAVEGALHRLGDARQVDVGGVDDVASGIPSGLTRPA